MKYVLEVCLIALSAGIVVPSTAAQSPTLQQGVSVDMVSTRNASPMPDADDQDAFIVTVTANGFIYLGISPTTVPELAEKTRSTPFRRGQAIYIKADARAPYAVVLPVLEATSGLLPQVLLTNRSESNQSAGIVQPQGLNVSVGSTFPSGTVATVVQLLYSEQKSPLLTVNDEEISWSALASTLRRHSQKGDAKTVLVKADTRLPFAEIVYALDACRGAGAKVYLSGPGI